MRIGLIGLPASGKTTCFHVLSGQHPVDTHHGAAIAVVPIPDERLDRISQVEKTGKMTYAGVTFLDFAALHKGAARGGDMDLHKVSGDVDAFAATIQCFGDLDHTGNPIDPASDLETILLEMALSDLRIIEGALERINVGPKTERRPHTIALLETCVAHLGKGGRLRDLSMPAEDAGYLRGFTPLTMKPLLVVCNVAEDDLAASRVCGARAAAEKLGLPHIALCAELEQEIAELSADDQRAFLADYGLEEPARPRFLKACFDILDLITFFTANNNEARAWTLTRGATAPEAAGKIHTDMQHGFIRAEVTAYAHFVARGSLSACKQSGHTRVEGKDYVVADGDILQIRFSR